MVCQNDESLALMITSTFLPAAAPPAPPPVLDDVPPAARPATTPSTTAISTITATSDSENLILTFEVILSPPEKTFSATLARVGPSCGSVKRERLLAVWYGSAPCQHGRRETALPRAEKRFPAAPP